MKNQDKDYITITRASMIDCMTRNSNTFKSVEVAEQQTTTWAPWPSISSSKLCPELFNFTSHGDQVFFHCLPLLQELSICLFLKLKSIPVEENFSAVQHSYSWNTTPCLWEGAYNTRRNKCIKKHDSKTNH